MLQFQWMQSTKGDVDFSIHPENDPGRLDLYHLVPTWNWLSAFIHGYLKILSKHKTDLKTFDTGETNS